MSPPEAVMDSAITSPKPYIDRDTELVEAPLTPGARTSQRSKSNEWQISNGPFRADKECNLSLTLPNLHVGRQ